MLVPPAIIVSSDYSRILRMQPNCRLQHHLQKSSAFTTPSESRILQFGYVPAIHINHIQELLKDRKLILYQMAQYKTEDNLIFFSQIGRLSIIRLSSTQKLRINLRSDYLPKSQQSEIRWIFNPISD